MTGEYINCNSYTYYGTATTTSGATPITPTDFNKSEKIVFANHSSDSIAVKTGTSDVTVSHPASGDAAANLTIVPAGQTWSLNKERSHSYFAVDSLTGSALYSIQYGNNG